MSTKAQRKQRRIAEQRGQQFALERAVLNATRALVGAVRMRGISEVSSTTWGRLLKAADALHAFHAERQRRAAMRRMDSGTTDA